MKRYAGMLKMVGEGATELRASGNGYTKLSVIEIGDHDVRGVVATGYMASQLIPGTLTEIWVQPLALGKYLMGVRRQDADGRRKLRRAGAMPFVFHAALMLAVAGPLFLLASVAGFGWAWWAFGIVGGWMLFRLVQAIIGTVRMGEPSTNEAMARRMER